MATELKWEDLLKEAVSKPGVISSAYRAFHRFSIGNQIAAYTQCIMRDIQPGPIASYKAWLDKGRQVNKGEKALTLCMPITGKGTKQTDDGEEQFAYTRFVWRPNWFVLSQTSGNDYAEEAVSPQWDKTTALSALGLEQVEFAMMNGNVQGYAIPGKIAINPLATMPHKTTFHEIAHNVLDHLDANPMSDGATIEQTLAEAEAESVAYILCSVLELPGADESRAYIQSWWGRNPIPEKSAQRIFSAADKILKAGKPVSEH